MEALIERLEQAVIRLEQVASKMQACRCVSNGHSATNGLDGKARCKLTAGKEQYRNISKVYFTV